MSGIMHDDRDDKRIEALERENEQLRADNQRLMEGLAENVQSADRAKAVLAENERLRAENAQLLGVEKDYARKIVEIGGLRARLAEKSAEETRLKHIILNADGTLTAMQMQGENMINVGTMLALININTQFEGAVPKEVG